MSGFGVKGPLRKAVVTENLSYSSAQDIYDYLVKLFENDESKLYSMLSLNTIATKAIKDTPLNIKGCQSLHMCAYYPDGAIYVKANICSCVQCVIGQFTKCVSEKGTIVVVGDDTFSDDELNDIESDNESEDSDKLDEEVAQLRSGMF
eukprot:gene1172-541_t